jgi:hypothetical protein
VLLDRLLQKALALIVRTGTLRVTTVAGNSFTLGDGSGPALALRFASRAAEVGILIDPELRFGEAYMDGTLIVEEGSIADVLALVMSQISALRPPRWARPQSLVRYFARRSPRLNRRSRARRNVATSTHVSTRSSSTPTGSTAAPISKRRTRRSTMRNSPRSVTSPPSCCSRPEITCSTSARAGAALPFTSPKPAGRASKA